MPIKHKNQQENFNQDESRGPRINPEIDKRLSEFMEANQKTTEYYNQLVKENPERAVRTLVLGKMLRHEEQMKLVSKQLPQVEEWVNQQPGLKERIMEKIKNINPMYQEKAFVGEAMRIKGRIDFKPGRQSPGLTA
jgi:hypothetical protein